MFDLQGHRGARGLFPENTLEGFAAALQRGIDTFEIDIAITADDIPVLHHDPALNPDLARGPNGQWLAGQGPVIRSLRLSALQAYDVGRIRPGSGYAERYPSQTPHDGARIPTLESVLAACPKARFNIELKVLPEYPDWTVPPEAMVERVLDTVTRAAAESRVAIQSFDWRAPRHARRVRPAIARGWLTEAKTIAAAPLWRGEETAARSIEAVPDAIVAEGGGTWTPFYTELTPQLLDRAHGLDLKVIPWTVNDPDDMRRLIDWGVDGLISDYPDRALPLLGR